MKKSKILLIAAIVGTICAIILFSASNSFLKENINKTDGSEVGSVIGVAITMPSMILSAIGTIFAWVGFGTNKRGFALTSGILYAVAIVLMIPWFMFNIIQMILSFVAYGTMGKKQNG